MLNGKARNLLTGQDVELPAHLQLEPYQYLWLQYGD
jgi:hypothetical protein